MSVAPAGHAAHDSNIPVASLKDLGNSHRYDPLPTSECIRLVRIFTVEINVPGYKINRSDKWHNFVQIETFPLSSAPPYQALSYTWSAPVNTESCRDRHAHKEWLNLYAISHSKDKDGRPESHVTLSSMMIGKNLADFLRCFRIHPTDVPYLWIDAVCINQNDLVERASQVSMMAEIYTRCTQAIAWLGSGAELEGGDASLDHFLAIHQLVHDRRPKDGAADNWSALARIISEDQWTGYVQVLEERLWFHRSWTWQEICFAPRAVMFFSVYRMDFELFQHVNKALQDTKVDVKLDEKYRSHTYRGQTEFTPHAKMNGQRAIRRMTKGIGTMAWLEDLAQELEVGDDLECAAYLFWAMHLVQIRLMDATDKRDKIYAGYGVLKKALEPLGKVPEAILFPDYTRSIADIYVDTIRVLLRYTPELSMLSAVQDLADTKTEGLPSWVPDFATSGFTTFFSRPRAHCNSYGCSSPRQRPTNIDMPRQPRPTLILQGHMIDKILFVQNPIGLFPGDCPLAVAICTSKAWGMQEFARWRPLLHMVTAYSPQCKWITLYHTIARSQISPLEPRHFKAMMTFWLGAIRNIIREHPWTWSEQDLHVFLEENTCCDNTIVPTAKEVDQYVDSFDRIYNKDLVHTPADVIYMAEIGGEILHFRECFASCFLMKRLFTTENGMLGSGLKSARPGDEIWLVKDGRMLLILRPTGDRCHLLVGESYVHGCMDSEYVSRAEENWTDLKLV
jgi:hypothetical protein